jgi:hypothetical protein
MADQKISQLAAAAALTGTELVPIVQSSSTVSTTPAAIKTYATAELVSTYGFGNTSRNVPDLTDVAGNYSQIGRLLSGAIGGTGVISSFVALPLDGTPTTAYVATANGRLWTGYKSSSGGTPTWTEYAKLTSPAFNSSLTVNGPFSGSTSFVAARSTGEIQSGVTSSFTSFDSVASTAAASFTLPALAHFRATGATVNSPSVVSNQYGFRVLSNLTAATNNFGFQSDLAAAANVWNLYFANTAQNYIRGNVGIGSGKTAPACALDVNGQVAQNTATSVTAAGTTLATATALTATFNVVATTPASSGVTLPDVTGTAIWIVNSGANALTVYPNSASGTINGGTAGAGVTLAVSGKMQYVRVSATAWFTMS